MSIKILTQICPSMDLYIVLGIGMFARFILETLERLGLSWPVIVSPAPFLVFLSEDFEYRINHFKRFRGASLSCSVGMWKSL